MLRTNKQTDGTERPTMLTDGVSVVNNNKYDNVCGADVIAQSS